MCMFIAVSAYADPGNGVGVDLRVSAVIIQCGTREDARKQCESGTEGRCCSFFEPDSFISKSSFFAEMESGEDHDFGPDDFSNDFAAIEIP